MQLKIRFFCTVSKASIVYMYVCIYIYIYLYIYNYIYTHIITTMITYYIYNVYPLFVKDGVMCCGTLFLRSFSTFFIAWPWLSSRVVQRKDRTNLYLG
jgi:hypothetical protein